MSKAYLQFYNFINQAYCPIIKDNKSLSHYDIDKNIITLEEDSFLHLSHELGHFFDLNKYFKDDKRLTDLNWNLYKEMIACSFSYYSLKFLEQLNQEDKSLIEKLIYHYEQQSTPRLRKRANNRGYDLACKFANEYNKYAC